MIKKLEAMLTPKRMPTENDIILTRANVTITEQEATAIFKILLAVSNLLDSDWVGTPEGVIHIKAQVFKDVVDSWEGLGK